MSWMKYHAAFFHVFLVEMAFLLSICLFLNIHNTAGDRNYVLFFLIVIIGQYIAGRLIFWRLPAKYVYWLVPVTLAVTLLSGDYFLSALLISTLPVWRLEQLHYSLDDSYAPQSIVLGLAWLIIITMISTPEIDAHLDIFNIIFIAAIAVYVTGRIIILAMDSGYGGRPYIRMTSAFILIFIVLSVLVTQAYRFTVFALSYVIVFLLNAMVFILRPFFDFLEGVELDYPENAFQEDEAQLDGYQSPDDVISETNQMLGIPFGAIVLTLVVIAAVFTIWSYFRKRETTERDDDYAHQTRNVVDHTPVAASRPKKAPAGKGRKMYFDFERWAARKGHGRYTDETIEEWFRRLSLDKHSSVSKLEHYQAMRYKDKELTGEELERLDACIREFKSILNEKA